MSQDIKATKDVWLNVSAELGLVAGKRAQIQNTSKSTIIRAETSVLEPTGADFGLKLEVNESARSEIGATEFNWVLATDSDGFIQAEEVL